MDHFRPQVIQDNPIGAGLDTFRDSFIATCQRLGVSPSTEVLNIKNLALDLVSALQNLPASRKLSSNTGRGSFSGDLSRFYAQIDSEQFDANSIIPLLRDVINGAPDKTLFAKAYATLTESTPPPCPTIVNSSEQRQYMDDLLKEEMGPLYVGIPGFYETFYGKIPDLEENAVAMFDKSPISTRGPLIRPNKALEGSRANRKPDIGFVDDLNAAEDAVYHWSQILVPEELKSNPAFDMATKTWFDLARYVREVLAA
ncbi:uncharacterized protein PV06_11236 [Exophiala oligosperma]|uniref:Fungal-type protein kinase domain-containing protein n=1 Tax=Exophiala oligosperma TaxID=215243 RepID=A0A0D2D2T0_9EURO|nr:uncharacterized protein PV06_11236 [Exophiala oligosperma]KIW36525.1 hypothetical protein PV06_11236 [Exophiala oligosperma]